MNYGNLLPKRYIMKRFLYILFSTVVLTSVQVSAGNIDVIRTGAAGDGKTDDTQAIQTAVDRCAESGGGTVTIPPGTYLTRPVEMRSGVRLHIETGATLFGSTELTDYGDAFPIPDGNRNQTSGLIWGRGLHDIAVTGGGTINGRGEHINFQHGNDSEGGPKRPKLIYFVECERVEVSGLTLRNSAYWVQHYEKCRDVTIRGLRIYSHCNHNNDGIDIDAANVLISDCLIDVEDDAICLKSDHETFCENVIITNCYTASNCNAIKLGTASNGGFRNIAVSNCVIAHASEDNIRHWSRHIANISADKTVISGIAVEMTDGGIIDGITFSNISMRDVQTPIFIKLGDRKRTYRNAPGILRNVSIRGITAIAESLIPSSITGIPGTMVENISLSDIQITCLGGGIRAMAERDVPERAGKYPENRMFGHDLPAVAFYVRHARGMHFDNIRVTVLKPDARPLFRLDDAHNIHIDRSQPTNMTPENFLHSTESDNIWIDGKIQADI